MSRVPALTPSRRLDHVRGTDSELIEEAARLVRSYRADRAAAQKYLLLWSLIFAMWEDTVPGEIYARMLTSAPTAADQRRLVTKLRNRVMAEGAA